MALDCYSVFRSTYSQAVADGLAVAVATAAAQAAMNACLASQSAQQAPAVPMTTVAGTRILDSGPVRPKTR